jgi:NAD(P)-dependent dehydrogenase (short-subunit alcohol dehydrogenase family)
MATSERVAEKVAIVTGGGSGIGRATAKLLAREGAAVMIADINSDSGERVTAEISSTGDRALFHCTDVSDPRAVQSLVSRAVREFGRLDVVFNNAAVMPLGTVLSTTVEDWDRAMAVNVRSVFLVSQNAARVMLEGALPNGAVGSIINATSPTGLLGYPNQLAYGASKGAIASMTRIMAVELAPRIRVNSVVPGTTDAGLLHGYLETVADKERVLADFAAQHLPGRIGAPDDVALAVLYLASDDASFVTGSALMVDGGLTIAKGNPT